MRHGHARAGVLSDGGGRVIIYDPPIDRPERPCSHCGDTFQPTARRRLLCYECFRYATSDPPTYPIRLTTRPR